MPAETGQFIRTRIAPTPSGFLHLGNIFSFALTAALAKRTGASILLRIDDLDRDRAAKPYVEDIFDTLRYLQIPWQEGPKNADDFEKRYSQLHRLSLYGEALETLKKSGKVYACNCSRSHILRNNPEGVYPGTCRHRQLPLDAKDVCWRLNTREASVVPVRTFENGVKNLEVPRDMQDFVIRKKDGMPAYQLTSVVDDLYFGVDLIVRGTDLWPSTLAQLYLSSLLQPNGFHAVTFYHHPLLLDASDRKLSKSAGDTSIRYLREHQWSAERIYELISEKMRSALPLQHWEDFPRFLP